MKKFEIFQTIEFSKLKHDFDNREKSKALAVLHFFINTSQKTAALLTIMTYTTLLYSNVV